MKTFLLNEQNKPIIRWGYLKDETYFDGTIPEGYCLAACPSGNIVVLDIDNKNGKCGYNHIPYSIQIELNNTFNYKTPSGGAHHWIEYTGNKILKNTSTKFGLDLRIGSKDKNSGGYVKYHHNIDIRKCKYLIKQSSENLNKWLEELFSK